MTPEYVDTVRLLLEISPTVFASGRFAMKSGTALNLFACRGAPHHRSKAMFA